MTVDEENEETELKENILGDVREFSEEMEDETPLAEENRELLNSVSITEYEKAFQQVFLELLDFGKAFHNSKQNFTNALLNTGSMENPQEIYAYIEDMSSRLEKITIVKRVCAMLGLINEMDKIIEAELELIYKKPTPRRSGTSNYGDVIVGDLRNAKQR